MTQRFGRNQRRRAREALAAKTAEAERLMAANTMNLALLRDVSKKCDAYRDTLTEARYVLGNHYALPPADIGAHPYPNGGDFDIMPRQPMSLASLMDLDCDATATMNIARMHELLVKVEKLDHSDQVHGMARIAGREAVYCISRGALNSMRDHPEDMARLLAREIAPQMATQLAGAICKGGR